MIENEKAVISEETNEVTQESNQSVLEGSQETQTQNQENVQEAQKSESKPQNDEHIDRVHNWRNLRERADKAARERDELARRLQQYEQSAPKQQAEEEPTISDDDLIEGKHLKARDKKYQQQLAAIQQQMVEAQIKSSYPDFDKVVTPDTLKMLRDADPDLADSIAANPNLMSKASAAYKIIKQYGFAPGDAYISQKTKVAENAAKPRPVSSVSPQQGESPLSRANAFAEGLTPELAKQLWKEMQQARKG